MTRFVDTPPYHIAHVGPTLEPMVDRLLAAGFGPFHYFRSIRVAALHRGQPVTIQLSAAFGCIGDTVVELLAQENDAPSAYREFLDAHPGGGLHHVAYISADFAATLAEAERRGATLRPVQEFVDAAGRPYETYYEVAGAGDAAMIQLALPGPLDDVFAQIKRICAQWDGTEPKRDMAGLLPPGFV